MSTTASPLDRAVALLSGDGDPSDLHSDPSARLRSFLVSGNEDPAVDSVLSMLGFNQAPVQQSFWNVSGRALATILSTYVSSETRSLFHSLERFQTSICPDENSIFVRDVLSEDENLQLPDGHGSGQPEFDLKEIVECILSLLKGSAIKESLALELLELLVKVVSVAPSMKLRHSGSCVLYEREHSTMVGDTSFVYPLIQFALAKRETFYDHFNPATRLLLWRLQPNLLWDDLSGILQKIFQRPLQPLTYQLRHVDGWHNLILGLASGPDTYLKARAILNGWILATGALCLFDLKEGVGDAVRDVLEHPSSWGLDFESGACLPPLSAFYHVTTQPLLQILIRPPSLRGLRELFDLIIRDDCQDTQLEQFSDSVNKYMAINCTETDLLSSDSLWMLFLEFPTWLQFAFFSLFSRSDALLEDREAIAQIRKIPEGTELRHCEIAAMYISWCFSPQDKNIRDLVLRMLFQTVEMWEKIKAKGRNDYSEVPVRAKRSRFMKMVDDGTEKIGQHETLRGNSEILSYVNEVEQWLICFRDSCRLLDTYGSAGSHYSTSNHFSHTKMSLFFSMFPLVALACSAELQNEATVDVILHSVMSGYGSLLSNQQDVSRREPSHRTEDYRDSCMDPFCQSFPLHASSGIAASGVARVFRFLESLDTIGCSIRMERVDGFKERVANQLMICIRTWCKQAMTGDCVTLLDDLRSRGSLWVDGCKFRSETLAAFHCMLQDLDAMVALSHLHPVDV